MTVWQGWGSEGCEQAGPGSRADFWLWPPWHSSVYKTTPRPLPSPSTAFPVYTSVSNLLLFVGMLLILD